MNATYLALEVKLVVRGARFTPMSGASYLLSKAAVSMLVALPTILLVSLAGVLVDHVRLSAGQWVQILLGVWLGIIPIVLLGLLIGLVTTKDSDAALAHSTAIGNAVLVLAVWSAVLALVGARRYRANLARA
jgi:hypothetical protein